MDLSNATPRIDLQPGRPHRVENALGQRFAVLDGNVWVTQDRDPEDRIFAAGEDFVVGRRGLTILMALDGAAAVTRLL